MTTDQYDDDLILGYIEDELTDEQTVAFEQMLKADPRLASLVASMKQDRQMLSELDQVTAPMEMSDYVSAQLERQMLLGPLPQRRKSTPTNYSTPQSRSHSRMMRIFSYGSLAAMFLVVVGLMYHHIGSQSLIERTEQMTFSTDAANGPTVVMKQEKSQTNTIDDLLKLPPSLPANQPTDLAIAGVSKLKKTEDLGTIDARGGALDMDDNFAEARVRTDLYASDQTKAVKDRKVTVDGIIAMNGGEAVTTAPAAVSAPVVAMVEPANPVRSSVESELPMHEQTYLGLQAQQPLSRAMTAAVEVDQNVVADSNMLRQLSPTTDKLAKSGTVTEAIADSPTVVMAPTPKIMSGTSILGDKPLETMDDVAGDAKPQEVRMYWDESESQRQKNLLPEVASALTPAAKPSTSAPVILGGDHAVKTFFTAPPNTNTNSSYKLGRSDVAGIMSNADDVASSNNLLQQQQSVCVIESRHPDQTINQITQWAVSNSIRIVNPPVPPKPKVSAAKPLTKEELKAMQEASPRQVITLDIPANQVPVLVNWLNNQTSQLNNWIAPLPQSNTANQSYQRLQQELPLAPTIPLVPPDDKLQVQLMVVPDTRPVTTDEKNKP